MPIGFISKTFSQISTSFFSVRSRGATKLLSKSLADFVLGGLVRNEK
jgi:hypothetical protein